MPLTLGLLPGASQQHFGTAQSLLQWVPISRAERRVTSEARARDVFGDNASAALDLFELTELAWHDCYGEITPPDAVIDNVFVCSGGSLATLAQAARLAIEDSRDLSMWADQVRQQTNP